MPPSSASKNRLVQESGSAAFLSSSCGAPLPNGNGQENAKRSEQFPDT